MKKWQCILKGQYYEIFASVFFHESISPQPQSIPLGPFRIFCENSWRYSQVKVHHWYEQLRSQILPPVSLVLPVSTIPAAHLPPVSMTPVVHFEMRISPRISDKIRYGPNGVLRGLGKTESWKNQKLKLHRCSFFSTRKTDYMTVI